MLFAGGRSVRFVLGLGVALSLGLSAAAQTIPVRPISGREGIKLPEPPAVEAIPVADDYFGTKIVDSYRWLEDGKSTETRAYIDAQNAYTARYMKQARVRAQAVDDLDALENTSEWGIPVERAGSYFFLKRLARSEERRVGKECRSRWTPFPFRP